MHIGGVSVVLTMHQDPQYQPSTGSHSTCPHTCHPTFCQRLTGSSYVLQHLDSLQSLLGCQTVNRAILAITPAFCQHSESPAALTTKYLGESTNAAAHDARYHIQINTGGIWRRTISNKNSILTWVTRLMMTNRSKKPRPSASASIATSRATQPFPKTQTRIPRELTVKATT